MAGTEGANFHGVPLSLISLVTLTCQNSALTILLHISRTRAPAGRLYSAASAVLLVELLKTCISVSVAFTNITTELREGSAPGDHRAEAEKREQERLAGYAPAREWSVELVGQAAKQLVRDVFSRDCWKLACPAILYVIQNNLQYVAASNLDVPTFQVTYNLKILTTALFSVLLLRRRLSPQKWGALALLFAGVAIVQLQSTAAAHGGKIESSKVGGEEMNRVKGLGAVGFACLTSGLAGCYFELVLKGSKVDLWIRNIQLSVFSLAPAFTPVFFPNMSLFGPSKTVVTTSQPVFAYFGVWAWSVVLCQVMGGLVTALVIKYSNNVAKGFATSLAIVLSFLAGVVLFSFRVTPAFLLGTALVTSSTYLYNLPDDKASKTHRLLTSVPKEDASRFDLTPPNKGYATPPHGRQLSGGGYDAYGGAAHSGLGIGVPASLVGQGYAAGGAAGGQQGAGSGSYRRQTPTASAQTPDFGTARHLRQFSGQAPAIAPMAQQQQQQYPYAPPHHAPANAYAQPAWPAAQGATSHAPVFVPTPPAGTTPLGSTPVRGGTPTQVAGSPVLNGGVVGGTPPLLAGATFSSGSDLTPHVSMDGNRMR